MNKHQMYFLIPADRYLLRLSETIKTLSPSLKSIVFAPHLTIYGSINTLERYNITLSVKIIKQLVNELGPISVPILGVGFTNFFYLTFFLRMKLTRELQDMAHLFSNRLNLNPYKFNPHLSLAYSEVHNLESKISASQKIDLSFTEILFTKLQIIESNVTNDRNADVLGWKTVAEYNL